MSKQERLQFINQRIDEIRGDLNDLERRFLNLAEPERSAPGKAEADEDTPMSDAEKAELEQWFAQEVVPVIKSPNFRENWQAYKKKQAEKDAAEAYRLCNTPMGALSIPDLFALAKVSANGRGYSMEHCERNAIEEIERRLAERQVETGHNPRHRAFMARLYENGALPVNRFKHLATVMEDGNNYKLAEWLRDLAAILDTPDGE